MGHRKTACMKNHCLNREQNCEGSAKVKELEVSPFVDWTAHHVQVDYLHELVVIRTCEDSYHYSNNHQSMSAIPFRIETEDHFREKIVNKSICNMEFFKKTPLTFRKRISRISWPASTPAWRTAWLMQSKEICVKKGSRAHICTGFKHSRKKHWIWIT
jgi:hypothetical protein